MIGHGLLTGGNLGPMTARDITAVACLHRRAFPGFFLSSLGEPFLRQFYRGFLSDASAVTVVLRDEDGQPCGAVVGTTEPAGFFRRLLRRQWPGLALASARATISSPQTVPRLLRAMRYRGGAPPEFVGALLSSICLEPRLQGSGQGGLLLLAWEAAARRKGAYRAFLTTDATGNDTANRFYVRHDWVLADTYATREGRQMNQYAKELGSPEC